MKNIVRIILVLTITMGLLACSKKTDDVKSTYLYPAFKMDKNTRLWGYIDPEGKFIIEPKYDKTHEFTSEGLAKIEIDGLSGVIDSQGREILEAKYEMIFDFTNGYFVAFDGKQNQIFNYKGEVQLVGENKYIHIGPCSDGLFTVSTLDEDNQIKMGYIDNSGSLIIEDEYSRAYDFIDGRAIVQENEGGSFKIIDKDNKTLKKLDYKDVRGTSSNGIYIFKDKSDLYGLIDWKGDIIVEDKFTNIEKVEEENILVSRSENSQSAYGVINKKGEYIIQPEYNSIILLGHGYFALSKELDKDENNIYAISNNKGELMTEFEYYNVGGAEGRIKNGLISVYDGENTYLMDLKGEKHKETPVIPGPGDLSFDGKVTRANISGKKSYYNEENELIWEETNTYILRKDVEVLEERSLEGKNIDIRYPVIHGLKNRETQDNINKRLYEEFIKSDDLQEEINIEDYRTYKINYRVNRINDLLLIEQVIKGTRKEDSQYIVLEKVYNINLNTGKFYELEDLFKKDSGYLETLTDIVRGIGEQKNNQEAVIYDLNNWNGVREDQEFILTENTIDLYFNLNQILSFSEELPRFEIQLEIIDDIIDYNSEFWQAYTTSTEF